jgi:hypothetical protein
VLDFNKPIDNYLFVSAGTEYTPISFLALRLGYRYRWSGLELDDLSGFSAGIGFTMALNSTNLKLDYAFTPYGVLGNSHRITLGLEFGNIPPAARTELPPKAATPVTKVADLPARDRLRTVPAADTASDDYVFYPATVTVQLRATSGRGSVFKISGESAESELVRFEGIITSFSSRKPQISIGEKKGNGSLYKYFMFRKALTIPVRNASCLLRVPAAQGEIRAFTDDNRDVPIKKIKDENGHIDYQMRFNPLESFRIEKAQ